MRVIRVFVVLLTVLWYGGAVDAQDFVTDGLVAMYTLNKADIDGEIVKDVFGANDAKLVGKLDFVDGARHGTGEALAFKGEAENYVEIPGLGDFDHVSIECYALGRKFCGI